MPIKDQFNEFFNYTDLYCYYGTNVFYEFFVRNILPEHGFCYSQALFTSGRMNEIPFHKYVTSIPRTYKIKRVYNRDHVGILAYSFGKEMP